MLERAELAVDTKGRVRPSKRMVRLPGETRHVERTDSAINIARKLEIDKRERRLQKAR